MSENARLLIQRGTPDEPSRWETFDVAFEQGPSVRYGIRLIRATQDPSLAFRFACINANACKECMIQVDGKTTYACTRRLEARGRRRRAGPNKAGVSELG